MTLNNNKSKYLLPYLAEKSCLAEKLQNMLEGFNMPKLFILCTYGSSHSPFIFPVELVVPKWRACLGKFY